MIFRKIFKKKQTTFCYCKCGNELVSDCKAFVKDTDFVYYKCPKCKRISKWDFDMPVPILIDISEVLND